MARRRFFVEEVSRGRAIVSGDEALHLTRVLRVEAGQKYEISDNERVWLAEVETARNRQVTFVVLEPVEPAPVLLHTSLYVALVKFERIELLIEKATELGVASMRFFAAERSERGLDRAAEKRVQRWQRIAREASEQSRRSRLPSIEAPVPFSALLQDEARCRLLLDEAPGAPPLLRSLPADAQRGDRASFLIGPEGGWTEREREATRDAGWQPVSLGDTILRTETAGIAALSVVNAHWAAAIT